MRKNKGETDQGRPNNSPLVREKKRFLLVFRSIRFRLIGSPLITKRIIYRPLLVAFLKTPAMRMERHFITLRNPNTYIPARQVSIMNIKNPQSPK
jgi:hypothetical protein